MLWVDQQVYCGPDRRQRGRLRVRERRHDNCAAPPPPLSTALRHLRMRVLDAQGAGADTFIRRTQSVAGLARDHGEHAAATALDQLAILAARGRQTDVRPALYEALDDVHAALQQPSQSG